MAPQRYFAGLDLFTFLAMPLFIFAGEIMNKAGITERLAGDLDAGQMLARADAGLYRAKLEGRNRVCAG